MKKPLPSPPYPAEIRAKGFTLQIDWERIEQSSTWVKCPDAMRPWLLLLWTKSWLQVPAGSYPNDDEEIAAVIRMDDETFAANRARLMRGWYLASDGRMYHAFITTLVLAMADKREKDRKRVADYRAKHPKSDGVTRDTDERTPDERDGSREYNTGTETGTGTETVTGTGTGNSVPDGTDGGEPPAGRGAKVKSPEDLAKAHLWRAAIAVLAAGGCASEHVARSFMGKLVKDYGLESVREAVAAAATEQPADAREYLRATCMHIAKGRTRPVTVAENPQVRETAAALAAESARVVSNAPEHLNAARAVAEAARERRLGSAKATVDAITGSRDAHE